MSTVTVGIANAKSALGNTVPDGAPTTGIVNSESVSGRSVPDWAPGPASRGIGKRTSTFGIRVNTGGGQEKLEESN